MNFLFPFFAALFSNIIAQILKPLLHYFRKDQWVPTLIVESGGFPSSHTSTVTALTLSIGILENFSSTLFVVTFFISLIVIYDAANVRYYAGKNIEITQQLVKDVQELTNVKLDNPVYFEKVKTVLGHRWVEVFGGIVVGSLITLVVYYVLYFIL